MPRHRRNWRPRSSSALLVVGGRGTETGRVVSDHRAPVTALTKLPRNLARRRPCPGESPSRPGRAKEYDAASVETLYVPLSTTVLSLRRLAGSCRCRQSRGYAGRVCLIRQRPVDHVVLRPNVDAPGPGGRPRPAGQGHGHPCPRSPPRGLKPLSNVKGSPGTTQDLRASQAPARQQLAAHPWHPNTITDGIPMRDVFHACLIAVQRDAALREADPLDLLKPNLRSSKLHDLSEML